MDLIVNGVTFQGFNDFGSDITKEFCQFYEDYLINGKIQFSSKLISESKNVFSSWNPNETPVNSDDYFNNFSFVSNNLLNTAQYYRSFHLWMAILDFVRSWENLNAKELHKGTPYYFCAVSSMLQHDFDAGMMAMSNALEQDKRNNPNWFNAPAFSFLSLNDQVVSQYFKPFVDKTISFIRKRLDGQAGHDYQSSRSGNLSYQQLRTKLLDNRSLDEDIRFYFVYGVIRIWHLRRLHKSQLGDEIIAPMVFSNALFDILLVIDELLKKWDNPTLSRRYFSDHYDKLARQEGWNLLTNLDVNRKRDADFGVWLNELLLGTYQNTSGIQVQRLEADFILSYGLRNFSAHTLKSQEIMWENYTLVVQSIFSCLFKILELL